MTVEFKTWTDRVRAVLESYDDKLLRGVANRLCRPRNQWPAAELIDRAAASISAASRSWVARPS